MAYFWFQKKMKKQTNTIPDKLRELQSSSDFHYYHNKKTERPYVICYFKSLIDGEILHRDILVHLTSESVNSVSKLYEMLPIADKKLSSNWDEIQEKILRGYVMIQCNEQENMCLLVEAVLAKGRQINPPEIEFSVVGPKDAFVESLNDNLNLIRKRLPLPNLRVKEEIICKLSKTRVAICYIDGITNEEYVNTMVQRIQDIDFDFITDSTMLIQMLEDNSRSPFPQLMETERPDRVSSSLAIGQVAVIVDGSPNAIVGPASMWWFLSAYEDYYLPWHIASFLRIIRTFAVMFSVVASPMYVAILTYHYQVIPHNLLPTIISSRINIPFPPFIEVIIMELTIELLREAGARLPTKVGQTIGIVGGIVIGTAAVQASLTSNILLIVIALSALASFTTPIFRMGNTIRVLRFPFIIAAEVWGILGLLVCAAFFLIHLLRLKSLGMPYMLPLYPFRASDFKDSIVRLPYGNFQYRFSYFRTKDPVRIQRSKENVNKDIDE